MSGIRVIRVWSYIAANAGFLMRTLDYISFGKMAMLGSLFIKTDIIVATSPQFFTAVGGWLAAKIKRKPWVMEVRDLWPESIRAVEAVKHTWILDLLERVELRLYRSAARVVVVTDSFRTDLIRRGIDPDKIDVIKNGVLLDQYVPRPKEVTLLRELNLANKFIIGYLGTHGMAHGLDFILRAAKDAPTNVHFLFIGDGAEKKKLIELKDQLGLANVTMLDPVPRESVARYISIIDVALVSLRRSDTFKTVLPSKIFENAAMGKPILLGVEGEAKELVEHYGAGVCYLPEDRQDFLTRLAEISTPTVYKEAVSGCQRMASDFDRRVLAGQMLQNISEKVLHD